MGTGSERGLPGSRCRCVGAGSRRRCEQRAGRRRASTRGGARGGRGSEGTRDTEMPRAVGVCWAPQYCWAGPTKSWAVATSPYRWIRLWQEGERRGGHTYLPGACRWRSARRRPRHPAEGNSLRAAARLAGSSRERSERTRGGVRAPANGQTGR